MKSRMRRGVTRGSTNVNGNHFVLANENGELLEVPYGKLVKADQEFVLKAVTGEERGVLLREESFV